MWCLESRDEVVPQVGASIAMLPSGMRLLDQLGIVDQVREGAVMHENDTIWTGGNGSEKGKKAVPARMMRAPLGGDIEYDALGGKGMEHGEKEVVVRCENGEVYHGDVLLGADGTHTFVRTEMRKLIEKKDPKLLDKDKKSLQPCRLDKKYTAPDIPRFEQADADAQATEHVDFVVRGTDGKVTLSDLWKRKKVGGLQCMDGGHHEHWTFGRIACFGDFVHKVTANALVELFDGQKSSSESQNGNAKHQNGSTKQKLSAKARAEFKAVEEALQGYHDGCKDRIKEAVKGAKAFTRIETFATFFNEMFVKYIGPAMGDLLMDIFSVGMVSGPKFDFLPTPKKSLGCFKGGVVANGLLSALLRTVFTGREALVTFMMPFLAAFTPSMAGLGGSGLAFKNHGEGVLDDYAPQRMQALSFLTDYFAFNAIWVIESCRRGNIWTLARIPVVFLLAAQLYGIGVVAPIYFFLHYVQIPSTKFHAADNRHVPIHLVKAILPTLLLGYVATTIVMYYPTSSISTLQAWNHIWQPFPINIAILHGILSSLPDTRREDRKHNVKGDLVWLRLIYFTTAFASSAMWIYTLLASPTPLFQIFFSRMLNRETTFKKLEEGMRMFLKYDELFCFTSGVIWVLLCFSDLKREGRLTAGWRKVVAIFTGMTLGLGPGAGLVIIWWWRDEILTRPGMEE
ncbi:uncharacterized protein RAG0_03624 [Rhynchosporium agropyri]|uniref:FAD-binding domain-containing protein n=1 Tax=Rhynchosporium agropyri TaxID=914238 RepID=A0A1E1K5D4_9HELO|nr:uncharacterized protein RAG0_03624 [Rhynchosporium agropyri]